MIDYDTQILQNPLRIRIAPESDTILNLVLFDTYQILQVRILK